MPAFHSEVYIIYIMRNNRLPVMAARRRLKRPILTVLGILVLLIGALASWSWLETVKPLRAQQHPSTHRADFQYTNITPPPTATRPSLSVLWDFLFNKPTDTRPPNAVPVSRLTTRALHDAPDGSLYRLGHSTVLIKLDGKFWLTDPMFSNRASPVQWAGPLRFHAPPISVADLPPIEAVILSHDHYDHLDVESIRQLANKTRYFVTPLGVGDRLIDWGVPRTKVRQLDWWQSVRIAGLELISTPAQHFSGRGLWDRNQTLWSSWVLRQQPANTPHERPISLYFSGDTGYFTGFKEIGERFGPFDLALMENGAYNPQWHYVHMFPAETLQAFIDVNARVLVPVHNGTFDLSMHAWDDPLRQITELATRRAISIRTPVFGERVDIRAPAATHAWWTEVRTK